LAGSCTYAFVKTFFTRAFLEKIAIKALVFCNTSQYERAFVTFNSLEVTVPVRVEDCGTLLYCTTKPMERRHAGEISLLNMYVPKKNENPRRASLV
jgi:hypothetical protein